MEQGREFSLAYARLAKSIGLYILIFWQTKVIPVLMKISEAVLCSEVFPKENNLAGTTDIQ